MMPGGRTGHVDLVGFLDRPYCIEVGRQLLHLAADDSIRQLVLYCDSAGGQVAGVPELSQIVRRVAAVKPLTVFVEGWCASGALWVASGARRIVASPSSVVGSIGAFVLLLDSSTALSMSGLRVRLVRSGGSGLKGHGADGLEITDDVIAFWQRHIDAIAASFEAAIEKGRRLHGERLQRLCNGEFWLAAQAKELGLIDDVQLAELLRGY
jgi:protease-4